MKLKIQHSRFPLKAGIQKIKSICFQIEGRFQALDWSQKLDDKGLSSLKQEISK